MEPPAKITVARTKPKGEWTVFAQQDSKTYFRSFYYYADAAKLAADLRGKSLQRILDIYGSRYFTQP